MVAKENLSKKKLSIESVQYNPMQKSLSLIIGCMCFMVSTISFAAPMTYEAYQQDAKSYCEDGKPWYKDTTRNAQKIVYPKFDANSINTWINIQRSQAENESPATRDALMNSLDPTRI